MVQSVSEDFTVVWDDPADAGLHWSWDKMHGPRLVPPLAADVNTLTNSAVFKGRSVSLNGYAYTTGIEFPTPTPEVNERGVHDVWWNDYVPRVRAACERVRNAGYNGMSATDLAEALDDIIAEASDAFRYTMVVAMAFGLPTNVMADFCEEHIGPDGGQLAATMLQGFDNESAGAGAELGELARLAGALPEVAKVLREGR